MKKFYCKRVNDIVVFIDETRGGVKVRFKVKRQILESKAFKIGF